MQNKLNFENMSLKVKSMVYDFVAYDLIETLNPSLDTTLPQIKNKKNRFKKIYSTIGTHTLKFQAVINKNPSSPHKYKLIDGDVKFLVCKENKLPFTLEILSLNNNTIENFNNFISIVKEANDETVEIEIPTLTVTPTVTVDKPKVVDASNIVRVNGFKMPKTDNPDILYAYSLAEKYDLSKTELISVFYENKKPNVDNSRFKLTPKRKERAERIIYHLTQVKGIFINKDIHTIRSYIRVFHRIDENAFEIFTRMIMSDSAKSLLHLEEDELKEQLNIRYGHIFGFELPIQKRPRLSKLNVD